MVTILHTNDFHGRLSDGSAQQIAQLKTQDSLYFDCGDVIQAGNLAIPIKPDPAWPRLARAGCDASVLGNRETHVVPGALKRKIAGAQHPLLVANMTTKEGEPCFNASRIFEVAGLKIGVFGVMVPMVTERMSTAPASAFLWSAPIPAAIEVARELRSTCDLVIALTHIGLRQDRELATATDDIDFILGGHSHDVLEHPEQVGSAHIFQTGSHGRFVGRYQWEGKLVSAELIPLQKP